MRRAMVALAAFLAACAWHGGKQRQVFIAQPSLQRSQIAPRTLRAAEEVAGTSEDAASEVMSNWEEYEESDMAIRIGNETNALEAGKVAAIRLQDFGQVCIDCSGPVRISKGIFAAALVKKWRVNTFSRFKAQVAVRPVMMMDNRYDNPSYIMRLQVAPVVVPETSGEVLTCKAAATDDKISAAAKLISSEVGAKGRVRMTAIGSSSLNRVLKSIFRANQMIKSRNDKANVLWAFPGFEEIEGNAGDMMNATVLDIVLAPP